MIEVNKLYFSYPSYDEKTRYVLKDINFKIEKGEFVAIIGHNGSGKSTLAKLLNGIMIPTEGNILINNMDTKNEDLIWDIRKTAGMVFQNPENQIITSIIDEEVAFGPENLGVPTDEIRRRVDYALEAVGMTEYKTHSPQMLSGGQKQRIAIASILAMMPQCIILDEPTAMLDPKGRKEVIETIHRLNKNEDKTILLITHNMEETVEADRIIVMNDGQIVKSGTPRQVFSDVEGLQSIGLDVPPVTEVAFGLYREGLIDRYDVLKEGELADILC